MSITGGSERRKISDLASSRHRFDSRWPIAEAIMKNARKDGLPPLDDKVQGQINAAAKYLRQDIATQRDIIETSPKKRKREAAARRLAEQQFLMAGVRAANMQYAGVNVRELGKRPQGWQQDLQGTATAAQTAAAALIAGDVSAGDTLEEVMGTYVSTMVALSSESTHDAQTIGDLQALVAQFESEHARRNGRNGRKAAEFVAEFSDGLQGEITGQASAMANADAVLSSLVVKQLQHDPDFAQYGYPETLARESTWERAGGETSAVLSAISHARGLARGYVAAFAYIDGFDALLRRLESDVSSADSRLQSANWELDAANSAYDSQAPSLERALERAYDRLRTLEYQRDQIGYRYREAERRTNSLRGQARDISSQLSRVNGRISQLGREITQAQSSEETRHRVPGLRDQLASARRRKGDLEGQLRTARSSVDRARRHEDNLQRDYRTASSYVWNEEREVSRLQDDINALVSRIRNAESEQSSAVSALNRAQGAINSAYDRLDRETAIVDNSPDSLERASNDLAASIDFYQQKIDALAISEADKAAMSLSSIRPEAARIRELAEAGRGGARELVAVFTTDVAALTMRSDLTKARIGQAQSDRAQAVTRRLAEVRAPLTSVDPESAVGADQSGMQ